MTEDTARDQTPTVTRNEEERRYEIHVDGRLGGFTLFEPQGDSRVVFPHTQIDPAFKGHGLGSILVGEAMADAAARGETVVPRCSFVRRFLSENTVEGLDVEWPEQDGKASSGGGGV